MHFDVGVFFCQIEDRVFDGFFFLFPEIEELFLVRLRCAAYVIGSDSDEAYTAPRFVFFFKQSARSRIEVVDRRYL